MLQSIYTNEGLQVRGQSPLVVCSGGGGCGGRCRRWWWSKRRGTVNHAVPSLGDCDEDDERDERFERRGPVRERGICHCGDQETKIRGQLVLSVSSHMFVHETHLNPLHFIYRDAMRASSLRAAADGKKGLARWSCGIFILFLFLFLFFPDESRVLRFRGVEGGVRRGEGGRGLKDARDGWVSGWTCTGIDRHRALHNLRWICMHCQQHAFQAIPRT